MIVQLWMSMGAGFLSFIAGLQGVDKTLLEAGAVDGIRNRWQELLYITLPSMGPQLMFGAVMQISATFAAGNICIALPGIRPPTIPPTRSSHTLWITGRPGTNWAMLPRSPLSCSF